MAGAKGGGKKTDKAKHVSTQLGPMENRSSYSCNTVNPVDGNIIAICDEMHYKQNDGKREYSFFQHIHTRECTERGFRLTCTLIIERHHCDLLATNGNVGVMGNITGCNTSCCINPQSLPMS